MSDETNTFERDLERANERRELLDICLELLAAGDPESKMKAGDTLLLESGRQDPGFSRETRGPNAAYENRAGPTDNREGNASTGFVVCRAEGSARASLAKPKNVAAKCVRLRDKRRGHSRPH
jgi:hypothetical protein